jgi:hypothetical protein
MRAIERCAGWLGRQPAVLVVGTSYAIALLAAVTLSSRLAQVVFIACPVAVAMYSASRRTGGWDVFAIAAAPAAGSTLAFEILGVPRVDRWITQRFGDPGDEQ